MPDYVVPLANPRPDIQGFLDTMDGKTVPDKPPLIEYLVDDALMRPILSDLLGREWVDHAEIADQTGGQMDFSRDNLELENAWLDNLIAFWHHMGYDFVRIELCPPLPATPIIAPDPAKGNEDHGRAWQGLHEGPIKNWDDFEQYPWPEITDNDFYVHGYICDHLPDGMGLLSCHAGGIYEHTSRLLGYENLCYLLMDDPELVQAVANKLGDLICRYTERMCEHEKLAAVFQGEDLGFNTQTLIPPDAIRKHILPWHEKLAQAAHDKGKRYYLHSCGQIGAIMEDLIEDVGIDGKHSFQDCILPVTEAKQLYGDRICLLGGVDIDKLTRLDEAALRTYVRGIIDACAPGGRYAVGSGNSVPSYIPVDNYLTVLDEALK